MGNNKLSKLTTSEKIYLAGHFTIAFGGFLLAVSSIYQLVVDGTQSGSNALDWQSHRHDGGQNNLF